jgi:hypothetical protein
MMRGGELVGGGPLHVVDDVTAVLAAMQIDGNEARLRRHETGTLLHQVENFALIAGGQLDRRYLRTNSIALGDFGHKYLLRSPVKMGNNA